MNSEPAVVDPIRCGPALLEISTLMDLVQQITKCTDNSELDQLKASVSELNRQSSKQLPSFERKKLYSNIQAANRAIEAADNRINVDYFRFEGQPQAPELLKQPESIKIMRAAVTLKQVSQIRNQTVNLDEYLGTGHANINNIESSSISNQEVWPGSVRLEQITDSTIKINTTGPLMACDIKNSVLYVESHQLRLHNVVDCQIYIKKGPVVMEGCMGVKIGVQNDGGLGHEEIDVFDFSWPGGAKNPHFEYIR